MNTGGKPPACVPTWRGHIETTKDALLVFEACFSGVLSHCFRRPHDRERNSLIVSGNVFIYEEATSGIKRWTDGIPWSPSRILTNFLIYRQLNSPFPPGEKKRATKRSQRPLKPGEPYATTPSSATTPTIDTGKPFAQASPPESPSLNKEESPDKDLNRGLVGSLVDSYEFKENGLLKKTMTVTYNGVQHHLVSYYSLEDAKYNLKTPREDSRLKDAHIRDQLMTQPKFKFPNLDDAGDGAYDQMESSQNSYAPGYYPHAYDPMRMYPTTPHAMSHAISSMAYHPSVYAPSHPPSAGAGYNHMPTTTSGYAPLNSAVQYPPQQSHQNQYYQHQVQQMPQYHHQQQQPQSVQYQPQQYAGNQPSMPAQQVQSMPGQQMQSMPGQQVQSISGQQAHLPNVKVEPGLNTLPRPNTYEYLGTPQNETNVYGSHAVSSASASDGMMPLAQVSQAPTWPVGYSSQWPARSDGDSYSQYRTNS